MQEFLKLSLRMAVEVITDEIYAKIFHQPSTAEGAGASSLFGEEVV